MMIVYHATNNPSYVARDKCVYSQHLLLHSRLSQEDEKIAKSGLHGIILSVVVFLLDWKYFSRECAGEINVAYFILLGIIVEAINNVSTLLDK